MANKITEAATKAVNYIDGLCAPTLMTKTEAVEYLELIIGSCHITIEDMLEEMPEDDQN